MTEKKLNLTAVREIVGNTLQKLHHYAFVIFLVFVSVLYGFILLQINNLSNTQPSTTDIGNQVKAAKLPRIDPEVVKQLESLQDNSVNVQTLFNEARSNPFQE